MNTKKKILKDKDGKRGKYKLYKLFRLYIEEKCNLIIHRGDKPEGHETMGKIVQLY